MIVDVDKMELAKKLLDENKPSAALERFKIAFQLELSKRRIFQIHRDVLEKL